MERKMTQTSHSALSECCKVLLQVKTNTLKALHIYFIFTDTHNPARLLAARKHKSTPISFVLTVAKEVNVPESCADTM